MHNGCDPCQNLRHVRLPALSVMAACILSLRPSCPAILKVPRISSAVRTLCNQSVHVIRLRSTARTSMLAGIGYVTNRGSVSVSTMPTVGMFFKVHSLIALRHSEGFKNTTTSGT